MKAKPGDRLIVKGHNVGDPDRVARILEVRGTDGAPPYVVEWSEDGHVSYFVPGSDTQINPSRHAGD